MERTNLHKHPIIGLKRIKKRIVNIGKLNLAIEKYISNESMNHEGETWMSSIKGNFIK